MGKVQNILACQLKTQDYFNWTNSVPKAILFSWRHIRSYCFLELFVVESVAA